MDQVFEKKKNRKASAITSVITVILFSIFFYTQFSNPISNAIVSGEGIEVNLGYDQTGMGNIEPDIPGPTASPKSSNATSAAEPNSPDPLTPSEDDIAVNNKTNPNKSPNNNPEKNTLLSPKPKALFTGNTTSNTGGNDADSYTGKRNQGIAGGNGNQGNPNGNANSDSYTGNAATGSSGVAIKSGLDGRRITRLPSFEDDFNENAKVAVDITVNAKGIVVKASINPKGSTTTNANIRNIALLKAKSLQLNAGDSDEQTGTLVFNFKLQN